MHIIQLNNLLQIVIHVKQTWSELQEATVMLTFTTFIDELFETTNRDRDDAAKNVVNIIISGLISCVTGVEE